MRWKYKIVFEGGVVVVGIWYVPAFNVEEGRGELK